MKSDPLRYITNGGLYQINVIVIFWQGFTACLAANDHFSSISFARPTAEHIHLRYFYLPTDLPPLYAMSHIFHIFCFDMLPGGIFAVLNTQIYFPKKENYCNLGLALTLKGLALMGNDAIGLPR